MGMLDRQKWAGCPVCGRMKVEIVYSVGKPPRLATHLERRVRMGADNKPELHDGPQCSASGQEIKRKGKA